MWVVEVFSEPILIMEFILDNPILDMRQMVIGLITHSMFSIYVDEEKLINDTSWQTDVNLYQALLSRFGSCLLQMLPKLEEYPKTYGDFFKLIINFSKLGKKARKFMLARGIIEKLLSLF